MSRTLLGLCGGLSLIVGILLLAINPSITQMQFALLGVVAVLIGVLTISAEEKAWPVCFVTIAVGFYFLARAGGYISHDWLRLTAGILALAAGLTVIMHVLFFDNQKRR